MHSRLNYLMFFSCYVDAGKTLTGMGHEPAFDRRRRRAAAARRRVRISRSAAQLADRPHPDESGKDAAVRRERMNRIRAARVVFRQDLRGTCISIERVDVIVSGCNPDIGMNDRESNNLY